MSEEAVEFVEKPSRRPQNLRKRTLDEEHGDADVVTPINKRVGTGESEEKTDKNTASIGTLDVFYSSCEAGSGESTFGAWGGW